MGSCTNKDSLEELRIKHKKHIDLKTQNTFLQMQDCENGIQVKVNPKTGELQGLPQEWLHAEGVSRLKINKAKLINAKQLPVEIRPESELPKNIKDFIKKNKEVKQNQSKLMSSSLLKSSKGDRIKSSLLSQMSGSSNKELLNKSSESSLFNFEEISESLLSIDQLSTDKHSLIDLITNFHHHEAPVAKFEKELLTSFEFKVKLQSIQINEQDVAKKFYFLEELGKGAMCKVYKAKQKTEPFTSYAVRIINVSNEDILSRIRQEIAVMQICQSSNIIKYHFSFLYDETLFMFIEFMEFGSLNKIIKQYKFIEDEGVIAYIIREILKGLQSIHSRRQIHRDLKSDNILINFQGDIKISDFGYALQFTKQKHTSKDMVGTPAWMAPQLIKRQEYTESVDIWSLGIILVELCQGEPKYLRVKPWKALVEIVNQPAETVYGRSQELTDFLALCLKKNAKERATVSELLEHRFIFRLGEGRLQKRTFVDLCLQYQQKMIGS